MSGRAQRLHDTPWQGVFYLTGGGISLLDEMLGTAGASCFYYYCSLLGF